MGTCRGVAGPLVRSGGDRKIAKNCRRSGGSATILGSLLRHFVGRLTLCRRLRPRASPRNSTAMQEPAAGSPRIPGGVAVAFDRRGPWLGRADGRRPADDRARVAPPGSGTRAALRSLPGAPRSPRRADRRCRRRKVDRGGEISTRRVPAPVCTATRAPIGGRPRPGSRRAGRPTRSSADVSLPSGSTRGTVSGVHPMSQSDPISAGWSPHGVRGRTVSDLPPPGCRRLLVWRKRFVLPRVSCADSSPCPCLRSRCW